ncbi:MAG: Asp-tRNA(Asn)/Glu-tRNA(Gln) amidotransferase subunit GatC [Bilophila sp.]
MLTADRMAHLARLARLAPNEATLAHFGEQCADIIAYMDILAEVDTSAVLPLYSPVTHATPYRADEPSEASARPPRQDILANAPESDGAFFVVPRIVG